MAVLLLLVSGCASGTSSYCAVDTKILPSDADIEIMSDALVFVIDAHDKHYEDDCE